MGSPYVSSRAGRIQWMLQRVSALLLIFFAFVHFGMQHFTSDAVSTGLATAFRLHNPFWQAFYVVFVVLVLFHGVNGTIGIIHDYAPKRIPRQLITIILWTLAVFFGALGIRNVVAPAHNLESAKNWYVLNGFPDGESVGNPPSLPVRFEFSEELRELNLLAHYLDKHTKRTDGTDMGLEEIFAGESTEAGGETFDKWCLIAGAEDAPVSEERGRHKIFSSTVEFARWATAIRTTNAEKRLARATTDEEKAHNQAIIDRLTNAQPFDVTLH